MEKTKVETLKTLLRVARILTNRDLSIETWRPGDGWTRYRVEENGGSRNVSSYLRKTECEQWLRAFIEGAESALGREKTTDIYRRRGNPWAGPVEQCVP